MSEEAVVGRVIGTIRRGVDDLYSKQKLASTGDAFAYWYLINRFKFSELEASDAVAMGGPNDKGLDAVYFDDDSRQAYCFQFKYSEEGRANFAYEDSTKLRSTLEHISDKSLLDKVESGPLLDALSAIHDRREAGYDVMFYVVVLGSVTKEASKEIEDINKKYAKVAQVIIQDSTTIAEFLPSPEKIPEINVTLPISKREFLEHKGKSHTSLVLTIEARELGKIHRANGSQIFARNVRYFLGTRGSNKTMAETLQNKTERHKFWFYHNGVTAVCDRYEIDKDYNTVTAWNFQIVNGCQTTVTLSEMLLYYQEDEPPPTLMLRLIRTKEDEEFLRQISKYTNTQIPIAQHDLCSNDAIQKYIQDEFKGIGYFYQRSRGEWGALTLAEQAKFVTSDGRKLVLENLDVAKAMMAFLGFATEAKTKKQMHFYHSSVGGYYDVIFDSSHQVWEYLLAYNILDFCERRRKEFQISFRDAEKNDFEGLTEEQKEELRARQFLSHSETHVAALIGELVKDRVAPRFYDKLAKIYETGDPKAIVYIHSLIEEILTQYFLEKMRTQGFQLSKYFKTPKSWTEIRSSVRGQMRILGRMAKEDPMEIFRDKLVKEGVPA